VVALLEFAAAGDIVAVRKLLSRAARPAELASTAGAGGWQALHHAAWYGHRPVVQLLLTQHPELDADARTHDGRTAMHLAAFRGHAPVLHVLLVCGANPRLTTAAGGGSTPLEIAQQYRHADAVAVLNAHLRAS
jgi:ankyrin repeat protein